MEERNGKKERIKIEEPRKSPTMALCQLAKENAKV